MLDYIKHYKQWDKELEYMGFLWLIMYEAWIWKGDAGPATYGIMKENMNVVRMQPCAYMHLYLCFYY